ncbi:MAG: NADH:ubiquinone reductase (Na(+)-transporting) subunit C [Bacteroidales bacterium]|nr:NADH:ubiquinone reductase (Na(+)-transporting) subunit C [Bacteroidales bacterium]
MFSNRYIFIYTTIFVVVIAAILSATAMFLQPFQERNIRIAKAQDILTSAGIESTRANAEELFSRYIVDQRLVDRHGAIVNDGRNPFDVELRDEIRKLQDLERGRSTVEPAFPLFISEIRGQRSYIIPVIGRGLWGPLWGYVALQDDLNTIAGVVFDHAGETPGLGSQIADSWFHQQFIGKRIFDDNENFVSVRLMRGGTENNPHGVDALSGGTITGDGLSETIETSLELYVPFFRNQRRVVIEAEQRRVEELRLQEEQRVQDSIAHVQAQAQAEQRARELRWRQQQQAAQEAAATSEEN